MLVLSNMDFLSSSLHPLCFLILISSPTDAFLFFFAGLGAARQGGRAEAARGLLQRAAGPHREEGEPQLSFVCGLGILTRLDADLCGSEEERNKIRCPGTVSSQDLVALHLLRT